MRVFARMVAAIVQSPRMQAHSWLNYVLNQSETYETFAIVADEGAV